MLVLLFLLPLQVSTNGGTSFRATTQTAYRVGAKRVTVRCTSSVFGRY